MQNLHELGLDYTLSKLHSLMKDELNLTDDVMFKYVEPKVVRLGYDDYMRQRNAYYIPVKQTLTNLLESQFWKNSVLQQTTEPNACVLSDSCDE